MLTIEIPTRQQSWNSRCCSRNCTYLSIRSKHDPRILLWKLHTCPSVQYKTPRYLQSKTVLARAPTSCSPSPSLCLEREGRWDTTDDFATSFLHFSLSSTAFWDLANSRPVHSLMLSSHLFLCLSCLLPPFTVPCKVVLTRPDERETCLYHCSLRLYTMVRRSSVLSSPPFCCALQNGFDKTLWTRGSLGHHRWLCNQFPPFSLSSTALWDTCPYHCSLRLFTVVSRSSCGPIARWILAARTSSMVTLSSYGFLWLPLKTRSFRWKNGVIDLLTLSHRMSIRDLDALCNGQGRSVVSLEVNIKRRAFWCLLTHEIKTHKRLNRTLEKMIMQDRVQIFGENLFFERQTVRRFITFQ